MNCSSCGQPIIDIGGDQVAHVGGGRNTKRCMKCHWKGSEAGEITQCRGCGETTTLVLDHTAQK